MYEQLVFYGVLMLAGGAGQLVRCVLGLKKAVSADKEISAKRVMLTLVSGLLSGMVIGIWTQDWRAAFFAGLGATDVLESLVNIGTS